MLRIGELANVAQGGGMRNGILYRKLNLADIYYQF